MTKATPKSLIESMIHPPDKSEGFLTSIKVRILFNRDDPLAVICLHIPPSDRWMKLGDHEKVVVSQWCGLSGATKMESKRLSREDAAMILSSLG